MLLLALSCTSCEDGVMSNRFCHLKARFTFSPVMSMPPLYTSCNSLGEWCTITTSNGQFVFSNLSTTSTANRTALNGYSGFYMGLSGFIVGLPSIPEMGMDYSIVTCYDRACSNCYAESNVTKPLTIKVGGFAYCAKCQRTYDLNNIGIVANGTTGKNLYRYRVTYTGDVLLINNY